MRTRILLFCGIVLAFCVWLLLHRPAQTKNNSSEVQVTLTNQPSQPEQPKIVENRQTQTTAGTTAIPASMVASVAVLKGSNAIDAGLLAAWQAPIEFYGKVIDENSNAIVGVNIHFRWSEIPAEDGMRTADAQSDSEGLFSLHQKRGASLTVWFSKDGYYSSQKGQMSFNYALGPDIISPDPQNPVVFHLHKNGTPEPLIHIAGIGLHTMRDYLLAVDGKSTDVSLLTGNLTPAGQGDLEVEFKAGPPLDNFPSRITWQCQVTVPGGGLMQTSEEFPFLAPQDDYQASDMWSITATNWAEEVSKQYYVKLGNGDFGRVNIRILGTTRPYFRMESFVNPSGSRNLEPQ